VRVGDSVRLAIDAFEQSELELAVMLSCAAVDGTAKKALPGTSGNRERFTALIRSYYWLLEPMAMSGVNLVETRWTNVPLPNNPAPDFAEIVYHAHRNAHMHGDSVPSAHVEFTASVGSGRLHLEFGNGWLKLPDNLPFGLIAIAVVDPSNVGERVPEGYHLTLAGEVFEINEWWGRAADFEEVASAANSVRVKLDMGDWTGAP
jgi:hypothetical protein